MPKGELYFRSVGSRWEDMYDVYGISFSGTGLSKLMTPAPNKAPIENESRRKDGKEVIRKTKYVKKDARTVTIEMHMTAGNAEEFWNRYDAFCTNYLDNGFFDIWNRHVPDKVFHMSYKSCMQYSEFVQQLAKFSLILEEADPSDRSGDKPSDNNDN